MQDHQTRSKIYPKQHVMIAKKVNGEYDAKLYEGIVEEVLTTSSVHYRGIKVRLTDGNVGRVQKIIKIRKK